MLNVNEVWQILAFVSGFNWLVAAYGEIYWVKIGSGNDGQISLVVFNW